MKFSVEKLSNWFLKNQRSLPWRKNRTPYRVWISEIMLQQTQVITVIPFYQKWMKSFPTLKKLSQTTEEKVIFHWQGLGYYNRAKNILKTAKLIAQEKKGQFPTTLEDLTNLPGIGKYTAGAISSFSYNQSSPVVDGNIKRVLTRYFLLKLNQQNEKNYWQIAENLIELVGKSNSLSPNNRYQVFNEALIELGALICQPLPNCLDCPLQDSCLAYHKKQTSILPYKIRSVKIKEHSSAFVIYQKFTKSSGPILYLFKRDNQNLLKGLSGVWEFPIIEHHPEKITFEELKKLIEEKYELIIDKNNIKILGNLKHHYTKYQTQIQIHQAETKIQLNSNGRFSLNEIKKVGLSKLNQKILKLAESIE